MKTKSGRTIRYFGEEHSDEATTLTESSLARSLDELFELLLDCWCRETAYSGSQNDYDCYNDPTHGQCAVTAALVNDMFGGTIHKIRIEDGETHYFNKINGHYFDLTSDQFAVYKTTISYEPNELIDREYLEKNTNTQMRLNLLKQRIIDHIRDDGGGVKL